METTIYVLVKKEAIRKYRLQLIGFVQTQRELRKELGISDSVYGDSYRTLVLDADEQQFIIDYINKVIKIIINEETEVEIDFNDIEYIY